MVMAGGYGGNQNEWKIGRTALGRMGTNSTVFTSLLPKVAVSKPDEPDSRAWALPL